MASATIAENRPEGNNTLTNAVIVVVVGILATTLSQPQMLRRFTAVSIPRFQDMIQPGTR